MAEITIKGNELIVEGHFNNDGLLQKRLKNYKNHLVKIVVLEEVV